MSRESLLDDAIAKAKDAEDWQLVEWLRMARGAESSSRWYSKKLQEAHRTERKILNENAKLRELVDYMTPIAWYAASERERDRMRELGVGVDDVLRTG